MAVQESVAKRWKEVTGKILTQAWGLTETSPAATINPPTEEFNGSIGLPIPSSEIAIKNDQGQDLPLGENRRVDLRPRPASDARLLEPPRRDRQSHAPRWLAAHR